MTRAGGGATPRWVKVFGVVGLVLLVVFVILHLTGHGFGDHHGFSHSGP